MEMTKTIELDVGGMTCAAFDRFDAVTAAHAGDVQFRFHALSLIHPRGTVNAAEDQSQGRSVRGLIFGK
ncbi:hypothetical protein CTI14_53765 [Methylobacterium radiotolerans]|nr:hypothetical protein CTI14_53765 [Methylobacterium radiotolerans]